MQLGRLAFLTAVLAFVLAPSALAGHQFTDVPNGAPFHDEIGIFKGTNITSGCTATTFCPQEYVRRQAMAAFIDRALGLLIRPGESTYKAVPGSLASAIDDDQSFVGTSFNALRLEGPYDNVVGGFSGNSVDADVDTSAVGATIAGGGGSGSPNSVSDDYGSVGGGVNNRTGNGAGTTSDRQYATVAGGWSNTASGHLSTVAGGEANTASGRASAVVGGSVNTASGDRSAVPGGSFNVALGLSSFAAGELAHANHTGSFVWSDGNWLDGTQIVNSTGDYSFSAHATGGFNFWTNATGATTGCWIPAGGGSIACSSDRNVKQDVHRVDRRALLEKVAKLPISSWRYKGQKQPVRHIGPMAQDFRAAFGLGEDDKSIAMVDADGISLAAIQGLYRENLAMKTRLAHLERTVTRLSRARR